MTNRRNNQIIKSVAEENKSDVLSFWNMAGGMCPNLELGYDK